MFFRDGIYCLSFVSGIFIHVIAAGGSIGTDCKSAQPIKYSLEIWNLEFGA
jgi:hypothetical protein